MPFMRESLDSSMVFLAVQALLAALLTARAVRTSHHIARPDSQEATELFGTTALAYIASAVLTGAFAEQMPVVALFVGLAALMRYTVRRLSMPGVLWLTVQPLMLAISTLWLIRFVAEAGLPGWIETLAYAGVALSVAAFGLTFAEQLAREAVLTHEEWQRPIAAPRPFAGKRSYKVSVQLPCYAEPPEVVTATLDRLAALDYDNYEVLVCDNNTPDEALWRPLEAHCARLNTRLGQERFRFFHVAPLPGAKAGALNWLTPRQAPDAEIIAVIDADYLARPDFLSRLVAFFDDPRCAYVQTPHDYRDYEASRYLTGCHWEYMPNNKVDMPGVSEYGGAFTIGTMCLLRADALRQVGGWAEWCLTEDSEVSVRLRAAGYTGLYLDETFGKGLIPDTFDDYKKQRFRWTAGPVQQLRRYWRLFLPAPLAPRLPGWTKLLEVLRCVAPLRTLFGIVAGLLGLAAMAAALAVGMVDPVDIPDVAWLLLAVGTLSWLVRTAHRYRLAGCPRAVDMVRGEVARMALTYTILVAGVAGLSSKPLAWRRTPKFAVQGTRESPFHSTMPETVLGTVFTLATLAALIAGDVLGREFALFAALGAGTLAFRFWCAPYMAWLGIAHANGAAADRLTPPPSQPTSRGPGATPDAAPAPARVKRG